MGSGIYTTNSAEANLYCLKHGNADIVVVEDDVQLQKVLKYKHELPDLKAIIQWSGQPTADGVLSVRILSKFLRPKLFIELNIEMFNVVNF